MRHFLGNALDPVGKDPGIIAHVVNWRGGWGAGFVIPLARLFPETKIAYLEDFAAGRLKPGFVAFVRVKFPNGREMLVANMTAQDLGTRHPLSMEALAACIQTVAAQGLAVHSPRIGAGLAGGNWADIEALLPAHWNVYTLPHETALFPPAHYINTATEEF